MLLPLSFLSTLLVLTLTMRELHQWPSIAGMSPQSIYTDIYIYIYIYMYVYIYIYICIYALWRHAGYGGPLVKFTHC